MTVTSTPPAPSQSTAPEAPRADLVTSALCEALGVRAARELISVVGGGGKSALLFRLGRELPGYSVLTTTTRIFASQTARAPLTCRLGTPDCERALRDRSPGLLVIGDVEGDKARGVPVEAPAALLRAEGVDFVVVEADGSRMRPAKAPADHEPVVSEATTLFVVVVGIDALEGPISQTCHRPERVARLVNLGEEDCLDPESLARLLCDPQGGRKGAPIGAGSRTVLLVNKAESPAQWQASRALASACQRYPGIERIVIGALEPATGEADRHFEVWLGQDGQHGRRAASSGA